MTLTRVEGSAAIVMRTLEREGKDIPLAQWIELLEQVISEARAALAAAKEDQRRDK